jgi:hypothetical protein
VSRVLGMYSAPVNALFTKAQNKESPILIILGPFLSFTLHGPNPCDLLRDLKESGVLFGEQN